MSRRPAVITQADVARHAGMFLYVIGPKRGPVKIGISGSADVRLAALQIGHPYQLQVLAEVAVPDDGRESEASIHVFLAAYRTRPSGEWFHRSVEVTRLIEMAYCRLPPDLIMEKLRAARQQDWRLNRAAYIAATAEKER